MKKNVNENFRVFDGISFPSHWPDYVISLALFRFAPIWEKKPDYWPFPFPSPTQPNYCGTGRFTHAKEFARMVFPQSFEWHEWSEKGVRAMCEHEQTAMTGCTTSGKSCDAALYALCFYLCNISNTAVLIASTTIDGAKKRIWKPLSAYYSEYVRKTRDQSSKMIGSPLPSICPLNENGKRDETAGIHIVAVAGGELDKGVNKLKGFHPRRLLLIGDETDSVNESVIEVRANLRSVEEEFQCIWLGNNPEPINPLGQLMEPEPNGVVAMKHEEWTSTSGIHCLRFDGFKSPNYEKKKFTGIITKDTIDAIIRDAHSDNAPIVWIMVRGLPPPEGADDTVVSEAALRRFNCRDKVSWLSSFTSFASLDPSRGGDACCFRTFKRGHDTQRQLKIECDEIINIPIQANDKVTPPNYQVANKVMELCKARAIPPTEFIVGVSGLGSGVRDVLMREWSPRILEVDEGGGCDTTIVSEENPRPAKEVYDRKVTQLAFDVRNFIEADMLRGLDNVTARQLCSRKHYVKGTGTGKRISIEKKEEMLKSPDEADALAFALKLCRDKGVYPQITTKLKVETRKEFDKHLEEMDVDSWTDNYSDPLLDTADF